MDTDEKLSREGVRLIFDFPATVVADNRRDLCHEVGERIAVFQLASALWVDQQLPYDFRQLWSVDLLAHAVSLGGLFECSHSRQLEFVSSPTGFNS